MEREPDVAVKGTITKSKETERNEWEYLPVYRRDENLFDREVKYSRRKWTRRWRKNTVSRTSSGDDDGAANDTEGRDKTETDNGRWPRLGDGTDETTLGDDESERRPHAHGRGNTDGRGKLVRRCTPVVRKPSSPSPYSMGIGTHPLAAVRRRSSTGRLMAATMTGSQTHSSKDSQPSVYHTRTIPRFAVRIHTAPVGSCLQKV